MKKQFLGLILLTAIGTSQASNNDPSYVAGTVAAVALYKGVQYASRWDHRILYDEEDIAVNEKSVFTTAGKVAGMTGREMMKIVNVGLLFTTSKFLTPFYDDIVNPAAALGGIYVVGRRLVMGADQEKNPTDMEKGAVWIIGGGILGGIHKSNVLPVYTNFVNGMLGR